MHSVSFMRLGQALVAAVMLLFATASVAGAFDLFAQHEVTVQFATQAGKPLADAEVRVFAPGDPRHPALTGHTDSSGRFEFPADADGFWSAEARTGKEVVRVMVRVGGGQQQQKPISPYWVFAALGVLLVLAVAFRILRARTRRPRK
jgi:hypothetical protein